MKQQDYILWAAIIEIGYEVVDLNCCLDVGKVCIRANVAHQAKAYPGFRSMKRLRIFQSTPPWMGC